MENRRDDWQLWADKTLRGHELLYERLDNRVHNAETIANEARAEFRAIRDEIRKELRALHVAIDGDPAGMTPGLRQGLAELKADNARKERREGFHWAFWTALIPALAVQFLILIGLLIVNWDKIQEYIVLRQHIHDAAAIERTTKKIKAKRAHKKPKPAAVVTEPEAVEPDAGN